MTDIEFTELDLAKPVDEMEADEARETLTDFMNSHRANKESYDELQSEIDELETEYSEAVDELEEKLETVRMEYSEQASEYVNIKPDTLASRFSIDELAEIIEDAEDSEEFSEETDETEGGDDEGGKLTTFSEKPEKGKQEDDGTAKFRKRAESRLASKGFNVGGE